MRVLESVARVKKLSNAVQVIAGNVATREGAKALIDAGADAIKVGIGPGSICTTRIVAGVGVPQLTAIMEAVEAANGAGVPVIADGGIKFSGDLAKALAAGRLLRHGRLAPCRHRRGSRRGLPISGPLLQEPTAAWARSAPWRGAPPTATSRQDLQDALKLVPEGIEGQVAYKGPVATVLHQLAGGLRAAMGYVGAADLAEFRDKARFIRITNAGLRESHVHDVTITRESPNYPTRA